ncbi:MAG: tetratricopeptide repeat protein [Candidatus Marinimicrobia bacterium]|nr:tetratricopeptide repeat protein [Candidatus Neomarinimicrobiota bacterium]
MLTPKKKLTKKELKHDPLLDTLEKGKEFYEENSKQIVTGIVAVVAILLLGWGWMNSVESTNNAAMLANTKVVLAAAMELDDNVVSELERIVAEYGSNPNAAQAILQLAIARMDSGDHSGARDLFSQLANGSDRKMKIAGILKLAYLSEQESNYSEAADYYQQVAGMSAGTVSQYAQLQAGYAFLASNDASQAKQLVELLLDEKPTGKFKEYVEYLAGKVL